MIFDCTDVWRGFALFRYYPALSMGGRPSDEISSTIQFRGQTMSKCWMARAVLGSFIWSSFLPKVLRTLSFAALAIMSAGRRLIQAFVIDDGGGRTERGATELLS